MKKHRHFLAAISSSVMLFAGTAAIMATPAMAQEEEQSSSSGSQTLDPAVGRVIQQVYEQDIQTENWAGAIAKLDGLIAQRGSKMKPYDTAIVYQLRGQSNAGLERYRDALRDFQRAVDSKGLPPDQVNGLRYVIAQIYFQLEDYNAAIRSLNQWINSGGAPDANAYYLLAAAYTQIEPPNFNRAQSPAERAISLREQPKKGDHDLLNLIYSELRSNTKRSALLEKMINLWPQEASYWKQLSGLYSTTGKDKSAFAVLEVAYRSGLLSKESEILTLVQYYSYFNNGYRGARVLESEMNAGNVKRNFKNLKLLSQLWSQAREHKRAIPVLEAAAKLAEDGELYYRLGQVLLADEQYAASERALRRARSKGGLKAKQVGDIWMLTGTARFSMAGAENCEMRDSARTAFSNATKYESSAKQARSWVAYIDAINSTEEQQDRLAWQQANDERRATIDRVRQQLQVCRLQRASESECAEFEERLATLRAEDEKASENKPVFGCKGKLEAARRAAEATETTASAAPAAPATAPAEAATE